MALYNTNLEDQKISEKVMDTFHQRWDVEKFYLGKNDKENSVLLSHGYQGDPKTADIGKDYSVLGKFSTAITTEIYNQVMSMDDQIDPILSRVKGSFYDAQRVYMHVRDAQAGFAQGGGFGNPVASTTTTGRGAFYASTGFFGSRITLALDKLALERQTTKLDGSYAAEAMARSISQNIINQRQRQRSVVVRTISDNEYTYQQNEDGSGDVTLAYGRLSQNNFSVTTYWQTVNQTTGDVTDNLASNPINDLIDFFTNPSYTIIQNTRPYLRGLLMSPLTARVITKVAQNDKNPLDAVAYMAAKRGADYGAENVIHANVPALAGVPIIVYDGRLNLNVDEELGTISELEYLIPPGIIIPILDYENVGMGTMCFTPDPRATYLKNTTAMPQGALALSDPRSAYIRTISSLEDPTAESPYWMVETGARYSFVNPIAPSTSYILEVADFVS